MPFSDCLLVNEVLAVITAITTILFAVSEYLGLTKKDTPALTLFATKKAVDVADAVVATVSPRTSVDGPRPWRKSCDLPRIVENTL